MSIDRKTILINGISVEVLRKPIKNLHLAVYPPDGRVRIATPLSLDDEAVRMAVISRLGWIRKQRRKIVVQPRESRREMVIGESHYFFGKRYRLDIVESSGKARVELKGNRRILLYVKPHMNESMREIVLREWYRRELKKTIPQLIEKWEPIIGVKVSEWGIKRMKTKWGSCNIEARRIWLNLELAKKPLNCIEYIIVHEMVHLLQRRHNENFIALMDKFLPNWRYSRELLNKSTLSYEVWKKD